MGIKGVRHGVRNGINYFEFGNIKDYDQVWCSGVGYSVRHREIKLCVEYDQLLAIDPEIDTSVFECADGCHPDFTPDCGGEYDEDTTMSGGSPNPFVEKFE